jgi:energy-coupling factor transporter ATP-binding protein EcfA2
MKRRANIAAGLLHRPRLLVLDEPTVGVDPQSRNAILESVEALGAEGLSVLYTTHYMEEAERPATASGSSTRAAWWPRAIAGRSSTGWGRATGSR